MEILKIDRFCKWLTVVPGLPALAGIGRTADAWRPIKVPGTWEESGWPEAKSYDGVAWYRAWVLPHEEFFTHHERNLFAESVTFNLRDAGEAHEVFINGQRVGGAGSFPPRFVSAKGQLSRHKVPPDLLRKGEWNEITIRLYNHEGPGGFSGEAPFIMDYFLECVLEGMWECRLGDDPSWAGKSRSDRPVVAAFDEFRESSRALGEAATLVHGPRFPPAESLAAMRTHPEFVVDQLLHEPLLAQPVFVSFDARGRLWVAQYRQYPYPAGVRPVSRDKYYRTRYDKVPPAPPRHDRGRDIISIHEDADRDGSFEVHKVFVDGLNMANAALHGRGGVWVMHTPYLLFYPDRDGDDHADGPPEVQLSGFGLEDSHAVANGLVWGPDGWLYGAQGSTTSCRVVRPGIDPPESPGVAFDGCMVWRYHPKTRAFELFAEGGGNTFGLEFDAAGRLFSGHNGGETRGWHFVQGGMYLMQGIDPGKFGPPRHPFTYGHLPLMRATNPVSRFSHFFAAGEGGALPSSFEGKWFALDPLHSAVIAVHPTRRGSTFETTDLGPVLTSTDAAFRPVHIANAPDGSLVIADMYEHYIAHGQHYQSQIDPTTGRIYRLRGKDATLDHDSNLADKSPGELLALLRHPNRWRRMTAARLLGERHPPGSRADLVALAQTDSPPGPLEALWALHQAGWDTPDILEAALRHPLPTVRLWAVRLCGDRFGTQPGPGLGPGQPPPALPASLQTALRDRAGLESDAEVRAQIASSAARLPPRPGLSMLAALLNAAPGRDDPFLPQLCWQALEHFLTHHRTPALELFNDPGLWSRPLLAGGLLRKVARRLVEGGRQRDLLDLAHLLEAASDPASRRELATGFEEAYRGRTIAGLPDELWDALADSGAMTLMLRVRKGDPAAQSEAIDQISKTDNPAAERIPFISALGEIRAPGASRPLLAVAASDPDLAVRRAALAALASFDDDAIGSQVIDILPRLPEGARTAGFSLLAARPNHALRLIAALQSAAVAPASVPAEVAEALRSHPDPAVSGPAENLFPRLAPATADRMQRRTAEVELALRTGHGNPYEGRALYQQRCASCHRLFFEGGAIGPDLTPYQRDNLSTLLISVLNPNAEVREGFAASVIVTTDGRVMTAFVTEAGAESLTLRTLDGAIEVIPTGAIKSNTPLGRSLMPEGLLDGLSDQQVRDFFSYLRSTQPIQKGS